MTIKDIDDLTRYIASKEGFVSHVYNDCVGVKTIGYGFTEPLYINMGTMTQEYAYSVLSEKLFNLSQKVSNLMTAHNYNLTMWQIYALTSFCYNLGIGKLAQVTNNYTRSIWDIGEHILLYNKGGRPLKEIKGLTIRRKEEYNIYCSGATDANDNNNQELKTAKDLQEWVNSYIKENNLGLTYLAVDGIIGEKTISTIIKLIERS